MRVPLVSGVVGALLLFGTYGSTWAFESRFSNLPKTENVEIDSANSEITFEVYGKLPTVLIGAANIEAKAVNGATALTLPITDAFDPVLIFPPGSTASNGDPIGGDWQGLAFTLGDGRVNINGEAGGLTAQTTFGMQFTPQNEQYLLNVVHWLDSSLAQ